MEAARLPGRRERIRFMKWGLPPGSDQQKCVCVCVRVSERVCAGPLGRMGTPHRPQRCVPVQRGGPTAPYRSGLCVPRAVAFRPSVVATPSLPTSPGLTTPPSWVTMALRHLQLI
ncbi:unnamed protein product [Rangifer tarandus platyrhynchus]|uniref:Uncharacterized protein n=1 Tax=Rangifer tarandus platyrhynchus TaxID=3082113 RepID=A0AC59YB41_RANTA